MEEEQRAPLLGHDDLDAVFAYHGTEVVRVRDYLADVARVLAVLPPRAAVINLCEDRYWFLVAMAAALARGMVSLLPSSRAPQVVAEVAADWPDHLIVDDALVADAPFAGSMAPPEIDQRTIALIGFTSGSTGKPKPNHKTFGSLAHSTAHNVVALRQVLGLDTSVAHIVATVPPQHMYGIEMSVYLPLLAGFPVHSGRPLFPADIARALAEVPRPRVLVSTPVHLRALLESTVELPALDLIVSATAPLDSALASAIEVRLQAPLLELFGSTETCVIAHRRTACEPHWRLLDDIELRPAAEGTWVHAPWFAESKLLQDQVDRIGERGFVLRGRNQDLIDIAGKRASLADLNLRLLRLPGVVDAVIVQPDTAAVGQVQRLVALVVAPTRTACDLLNELKTCMDPAFLPRPLKLVERLPRNDTGKLRREDVLAMIST